MKILQINNCHYRRGGADVVYLNTGLLLEKMGHTVVHFSKTNNRNLPSAYEEYFLEDINFFPSNFWAKFKNIFRFLYSFEAKQKLGRLLKETKPDIAHIHFYKGTLTPAILAKLKKYGIPVIITLHDWGLLCPHNTFLDGKNNLCVRCINKSAVNCIIHKCNRNNLWYSIISALEFSIHKYFFPFQKYFDVLITVSEFGFKKHSLNKKYFEKLELLYNFYPALKETTTSKVQGSYFLFYGRLSSEKGIITLINAWLLTKRKGVLKIVGEGPLFDKIASDAKRDQNCSIEVQGYCDGDKLLTLIGDSSFVIVPSEWYENNPLTIIEAFALGKPVIGANIGGIPELIIDNENGFLFESRSVEELSNAIAKAEKLNHSEYMRLSLAARQFALNNFEEAEHYDKLISIYEKAIKNAKI
jgi:glycosyltransferase involved in cell wall biosynthesis